MECSSEKSWCWRVLTKEKPTALCLQLLFRCESELLRLCVNLLLPESRLWKVGHVVCPTVAHWSVWYAIFTAQRTWIIQAQEHVNSNLELLSIYCIWSYCVYSAPCWVQWALGLFSASVDSAQRGSFPPTCALRSEQYHTLPIDATSFACFLKSDFFWWTVACATTALAPAMHSERVCTTRLTSGRACSSFNGCEPGCVMTCQVTKGHGCVVICVMWWFAMLRSCVDTSLSLSLCNRCFDSSGDGLLASGLKNQQESAMACDHTITVSRQWFSIFRPVQASRQSARMRAVETPCLCVFAACRYKMFLSRNFHLTTLPQNNM